MKTNRIEKIEVQYLQEGNKVRLEIRVLAFNANRQESYWVLTHSKAYNSRETAERKFKEYCKIHNLVEGD